MVGLPSVGHCCSSRVTVRPSAAPRPFAHPWSVALKRTTTASAAAAAAAAAQDTAIMCCYACLMLPPPPVKSVPFTSMDTAPTSGAIHSRDAHQYENRSSLVSSKMFPMLLLTMHNADLLFLRSINNRWVFLQGKPEDCWPFWFFIL